MKIFENVIFKFIILQNVQFILKMSEAKEYINNDSNTYIFGKRTIKTLQKS